MIESTALKFQYPGGLLFEFPDIACQAKEELLILGSSGCGKTTLLHLLGGLLKPQSGQIRIQGQDIQSLEGAALDRFRGQHIGIIFQQSHVLKALTVLENLLTAQYLAKKPQDSKAALALLEQLNIGHRAKASAASLSLGEQQRLAIARALINSPSLVLADEPTSSLDDQNCQEVLRLLLEQSQAKNAALLIVTHDARLKDSVSKQVLL